VVIGVITNSDDRVPDVLASLGLRVSSARYPLSQDISPESQDTQLQPDNHVDFHCMSYDVGFFKPDRRIFDAAEGMARRISIPNGNSSDNGEDGEWIKVYVGDDWDKDALGSTEAGWSAVYIAQNILDAQQGAGVSIRDLEGTVEAPEETLSSHSTPVCLRAGSIGSVLEWFAESRGPER
jgi:hypothetical protein